MKKKFVIRLFAAIGICMVSMIAYRYITFDRSAVINFEGGFIWNDIQYVPVIAETGNTGRCIAETTDGHKIREFKDDPTHTFLEIRSFLDNNKVVRADYTIPTEGNITCAYISGNRVSDGEVLELLSLLKSYEYQKSFYIRTDNIYYIANDIYVGYNGCPVGTQWLGCIGDINGKLVFIPASENTLKPGVEQIFECDVIPSQYEKMLTEYIQFETRMMDTVSQ